MGSEELLVRVTRVPPAFTKLSRLTTPCSSRPPRMSSVETGLPRFGVTGVAFHGIGRGPCRPVSRLSALALDGPNTMTSYLSRSRASSRTSCTEM